MSINNLGKPDYEGQIFKLGQRVQALEARLSFIETLQASYGNRIDILEEGGTPTPTPGPSPTLTTLSLSGTLTNGSASSGSIIGATQGSTITDNVDGLTVNSGARTYAWDGTGAEGTVANGLVETLAGATNSPRSSIVTIQAATAQPPSFTVQPSITTDGSPAVGEQLVGNDGTISNGSVSSRQWLLAGAAITGATGATYTPTQAGQHSYRVTATGPGGTATATSSAVAVSTAPTPEASELPTLSVEPTDVWAMKRVRSSYSGPLATLGRNSDSATIQLPALANREPDVSVIPNFVSGTDSAPYARVRSVNNQVAGRDPLISLLLAPYISDTHRVRGKTPIAMTYTSDLTNQTVTGDARNSTVVDVVFRWMGAGDGNRTEIGIHTADMQAGVAMAIQTAGTGQQLYAKQAFRNTQLPGRTQPVISAVRAGPSTVTLFVDERTRDLQYVNDAGTWTGLCLGRPLNAQQSSFFSLGFDWFATLVYPAALTDADMAKLQAWAEACFDVLRTSATDTQLLMPGNSNVQSSGSTYGGTWPARAEKQFSKRVVVKNLGIFGQTAATIYGQINKYLGMLDSASFARQIVLAPDPSNDFEAGDTASNAWNNIVKPYIQQFLNAGAEIMAYTTLPRNTWAAGSAKENERVAFNQLLRDNAQALGYTVVDFAAVPGVTYTDGVHPDDAGNQKLADAFYPAFNNKIANPPLQPTQPTAPVFATKPSISPASGNTGQTFTGTDGTLSGPGSVTSRRWLLSGTAIGTGQTVTPNAAGSLVFENTATNGGVTTVSTSDPATVNTPTPTPAARAEDNFNRTAVAPSTAVTNSLGSTPVGNFPWLAAKGAGINADGKAYMTPGQSFPTAQITFTSGEPTFEIDWVRPGGTDPYIFIQWDPNNFLVVRSSGIFYSYVNGANGTVVDYGGTPTGSNTYRVKLVRKGTSAQLFVDGVQRGATITLPSNFPTNNPAIGFGTWGTAGGAELFDNVVIYPSP